MELRLSETGEAPDVGVFAVRAREADEFYAELTPPHASLDEAMVLRQALAGMLW